MSGLLLFPMNLFDLFAIIVIENEFRVIMVIACARYLRLREPRYRNHRGNLNV